MGDGAADSALCHGGPLDGERVEQAGRVFLAVDKLNGRAWLYRRQPDDSYVVDTSHDNSLNYPAGTNTGERFIDWDRLPKAADPMPVVSLGDSPEAHAGDLVDDGW